jgi:hypothetical protein
MFSRAFLGLCVLAAATAVAPRASADDTPVIFDSVDTYQARISNGADPSTFVVTGIIRGQATAQTIGFHFYANSFDPQLGLPASCERYALIAMKDAGHYSFVVTTQTPSIVVGCSLERR